MFIKKLKINEAEYEFEKKKKIVFVKENEAISGEFCKALKEIFIEMTIWIDCASKFECDLYCECEKNEIDFYITVKAEKVNLYDRENYAGLCGNFEAFCKYQPKMPLTDEQRRLLRLVELDYQEFLLPRDTSAETAFYRYDEYFDFDYTQTILYDNFIEICKAEDVVKEFIDSFKNICYGNYRLGFNRQTQKFGLIGVEISSDKNSGGVSRVNFDDITERQWKVFALFDFITANKLNEKLQDFYRFDGKTPLFIENAFENMTDEEIGMFMKEIVALDRQTFIIEKRDNAFLESFCDSKVIFETSLDEDVF